MLHFQIETNRNTALTLACFQGRHEVVSLLVDRRATIEHRAKVCGVQIVNKWINETNLNMWSFNLMHIFETFVTVLS